GLAADQTPVPVAGGARLVGRMGGWDVGLLDMETRAQHTSPSENFGVLRLRHPVVNPWSTVGVLATSYISGGRRNTALGGDGVFRYHGDQYLTLKLAGTADDSDTSSVSLSDRSLVDLKLER